MSLLFVFSIEFRNFAIFRMYNFPYIRSMKFFCLLFAVYTLTISVMPCNDVHEETKISISSFSEAQDHHQEHHDICSPFCIRSCCQGFVALTSFPDVTLLDVPIAANLSLYTDNFFSSALASIWQPPKMI